MSDTATLYTASTGNFALHWRDQWLFIPRRWFRTETRSMCIPDEMELGVGLGWMPAPEVPTGRLVRTYTWALLPDGMIRFEAVAAARRRA